MLETLDLKPLADLATPPELLGAFGQAIAGKRSLAAAVALLDAIPEADGVVDWNVSVVLAYLPADLVVEAMRTAVMGRHHLESRGLAWALGEMTESRPEIVAYLQRVVWEAGNSDTWWRAGFSLQKLGEGDAVALLTEDLRRRGVPKLTDCLDDVSDKRAMLGVMLHAEADLQAKARVAVELSESLLESDDEWTLVATSWLLGRLHIMDDELLERIRELAQDETHDVRYYALFALQNNPRPGGLDIAVRALADDDPLVRRVAVRAVAAIGTPEAKNRLREQMSVEQNPKVLSEIRLVLEG
jgi:HEAT repeat protein